MSTVSSVELEEIARGLAQERFDEHAARGLARAYEEFVGRRRRAVGPVALAVEGRAYSSFYAILADPTVTPRTGELRLERAAGSPADWEFLTPFDRLVFHDDGSAELYGPDGAAPRRAIARFLLREHYLVRSRRDDAPETTGGPRPRLPGLVGTLEQGTAACRAVSALPFGVAVLLYLAEERVRYELDLVHSTLLCDPRAGRFAAARRVRRSSRIAWGLDRKLARGHLSLLASRCLEVLVESNGLTVIDLTHVFGGVRELVDSALQTLVQQRYASFDPRTGVYRARIDSFLPVRGASAAASPAPVRPELRTSVQELIAAADARAACPLCGKPLPPQPHALLCDDCAAKVGLTE
ncbi:MAG TPA: hypothetical protein VEH10_03575 [Thermoplasmata archaeon]|nr:hypothetical protein [Thermoplasmata archaeon]